MLRIVCAALIGVLFPLYGQAQEPSVLRDGQDAQIHLPSVPSWMQPPTDWSATGNEPNVDMGQETFDRFAPTSPGHLVIRGQSPDEKAGGGPDPNNPAAILAQLQIQNIFTPETHDAVGYSNTVIVQPVLPFPVAMPGLKEIFPAHIIRPTLPIISPTADPLGPAAVEGGLGDLVVVDFFVHPVEDFGSILVGYDVVIPTLSHPQLGLGEWQMGPVAAVIYTEVRGVQKPRTDLNSRISGQSRRENGNVEHCDCRFLAVNSIGEVFPYHDFFQRRLRSLFTSAFQL